MKKYTAIIVGFYLLGSFCCFGNEEFSYEAFAFLEETTWETNFGLLGETGTAEFVRVSSFEKVIEQRWWDQSFDYFGVINSNTLIHLGTGLNYSIEFRDSSNLMILHCEEDSSLSSVVYPMSGESFSHSLFRNWRRKNKEKALFEFRELPESDYDYIFYYQGIEWWDEEDRDIRHNWSWFLLKYQDFKYRSTRLFNTVGVFEDDKYSLEIVNEKQLLLTPQFERNPALSDRFIIHAKE